MGHIDNFMKRPFFLPLISLLLLIAACAGPERMSLDRIYGNNRKAERIPVIVIPGFMGSRLEDTRTGREIWPGPLLRLVSGLSNTPQRLIADIDHSADRDFTRPSGLFLEAFGQDYYQSLVSTLEQAGGYQCAMSDRLDGQTDCALLAWDWRRHPTEAAQALAETIDRLRTLRNDPDLQVDVIAHSAGGIVARAYLGGLHHPGGKQPDTVRRLVLLAVPNLGSIDGLQTALRGARFGLTKVQPEVIARFPGVFSLLPHPQRDWMVDIDGQRFESDLYDIETWRRFKFSVFDPEVRARVMTAAPDAASGRAALAALERQVARYLVEGKEFHRSIDGAGIPSSTQIASIGSGCYETPAVCLVERVGEREFVRLTPDEIARPKPGVDYNRLMIAPGDGEVTRVSVLGPKGFDPGVVRFLCVPHAEIARDPTFRDNLLNILTE
ncbi:esterase/lipase family protein [Roseovarius arcticus]|uniref:esterase/lipase family protein n=1 Tax=Roseovarius arcticus TaxID=2547404 RepID=UPI00111072E1|nr:hypothetical protein [Roseovarius arcticus]